MAATEQIKITQDTKRWLYDHKDYERDTYNDVIERLIGKVERWGDL